MNTVMIERGETKMVAHRGVSGLERENTCPAFVAAGVKSYWGIETDVHITADEKYVISHDENLKRCSGVDIVIEQSKFDTIRSIPLLDTDGETLRTDLFPPTLDDYIAICRKYGKQAVLELKNPFPEKHVAGVIDTITQMGWYERTTLISFCRENLVIARRLCPDLDIEFLGWKCDDDTLDFMKRNRIGADIFFKEMTPEFVAAAHEAGLAVNVWTVNEPADAARLIAMGVDQITTNILE